MQLQRFMGRTGYQIFADRFCCEGAPPQPIRGRTLKNWNDSEPEWGPDNDGEYRNSYFYGGNLKGIISKLAYLEEMGVSLIYLSPISKTPSSHHYDVEDQRIIDPWIGTWQDFIQLCEEAHKRDILICVDLVFNHMGINGSIFQEALHNPWSQYREWFEWDQKGEPIFWYGFKDMPQCDKLNSAYQEYACDVCEFYLRMGADGIRLDLGENFPKEFMQVLRKRVKSVNPEAIIVNEMWDFATHKANSQIDGDQADSVMNYPLADAICRLARYGNVNHFLYTWKELKQYPEQVQDVLWNFLDSHDIPRASNMLAGQGMLENPYEGRIWDIEAPWRIWDRGQVIGFKTFEFRKWEAETDHLKQDEVRKKLMLASLMQYSARGMPIVYYGTEAGLTGGKDPFCRKPYPWNNEDSILLKYYQNLGAFRKKYRNILSQGKWKILCFTDSVLVYERVHEGKELVFAINWTEQPKFYRANGGKEVFSLQSSKEGVLEPYGAIVYEINRT